MGNSSRFLRERPAMAKSNQFLMLVGFLQIFPQPVHGWGDILCKLSWVPNVWDLTAHKTLAFLLLSLLSKGLGTQSTNMGLKN